MSIFVQRRKLDPQHARADFADNQFRWNAGKGDGDIAPHRHWQHAGRREHAKYPEEFWGYRFDELIRGRSTTLSRLRVSIGRLDTLQVTHEKVLEPPLAIAPAGAVAAIGHEQQIEIFFGPNERIHKPKGAFGRDVVVHLADDQHKIALKFGRVFDVRALGVLWTHRIAHPLLVPGGLVHAVIVATAVGNRRLVKFRMKQRRSGGVLASGGIAIDANAADVIPRVFGCRGFVPEDAIRKAGVFEVLPANVVEGFRAVGRAHAVYLDNDETEIRKRG